MQAVQQSEEADKLKKQQEIQNRKNSVAAVEDELAFRPKKAQKESEGFFASIFGCCAGTKSKQSSAKVEKRAEKKPEE